MRSVLGLMLLAFGAGFVQEPPGVATGVPELAGFRYEAGRIPAGRVYRYERSNLDGSNPSEVALYLASETHFEVLRWCKGVPAATLVQAEMDWDVASVASLASFRIDERGERALVAELETSPDRKQVVARVDGRELVCALARFPWHGYDFDFAGLNVALRFLADPVGETEFEVVALRQVPGGPELAAKGAVRLAYAGGEDRAGRACRRYSLAGSGLEGRSGSLWVARDEDAFLVALELDLPDEPSMDSVRLEWQRNETMSPAEWQEFVGARKDAGPR